MIDALIGDVRYASRAFLRSPGFSLLVVLTIAIGIGANTAIFSVVDAVLLAPLPYPGADRLVVVAQNSAGSLDSASSPVNIAEWRSRSRTIADVCAVREARLALMLDARPEQVTGAIATTNIFDVLGVGPILGRAFAASDAAKPGARVVVLGERFWRQRFAAAPDVVGRSLRIEGETVTVIGVMPAAVDYPTGTDLWLSPRWRMPEHPLAPDVDPATMRSRNYLDAIARLKAGITIEQARADLALVDQALAREYPDDDAGTTIAVAPLHEDLVGRVRPTLIVLFGSVAFLLVVAAANVSGLLLARATTRRQEIAIRVALGAGARRVLAQLLTESTCLAFAGAAVGILLAAWVVGPLASLAPAGALSDAAARLDRRVLVFCVVIAVSTGVLIGIAPARHLLHVDPHDDLKGSRRVVTASHGGRGALVVAQIALTMVLLLGAGLMLRSFVRVLHVPPGFDPDGLLTLTLDLPPARYPTPEARSAFWREALDALAAAPGAGEVGASTRIPLSGGNSGRGFTVEGKPADPSFSADYRVVTRDYFKAMRIPILRGRPVDDRDHQSAPLAAVISESMARRFWPGVDAIGRRFSIDGEHFVGVVGIVGDVHHSALEAEPQPTMYVPYQQDPWPFMTFVLRPRVGTAAALAGPARDGIWRIDRELPLTRVSTMTERIGVSLARRRFGVTLLSAFGGIALLLAAIGLYGVLALMVTERRREIGLRLALGAQPSAVVRNIAWQGARVALTGLAVGVALALATGRLLGSLLYSTSAADPATYSVVVGIFAVVGIAASIIPAMRAARVDPMATLRDS